VLLISGFQFVHSFLLFAQLSLTLKIRIEEGNFDRGLLLREYFSTSLH